VSLTESSTFTFVGLGEQSQSSAGDSAAPRVNVREKWAPPEQEFQGNYPHPTFKIPIKGFAVVVRPSRAE